MYTLYFPAYPFEILAPVEITGIVFNPLYDRSMISAHPYYAVYATCQMPFTASRAKS